MRSPLELLEAVAREEVLVTPDLRHLEIYTLRGLLTILWHGHGEVEILRGAGHLLTESADHLRLRLGTWIPERFDAAS